MPLQRVEMSKKNKEGNYVAISRQGFEFSLSSRVFVITQDSNALLTFQLQPTKATASNRLERHTGHQQHS
jgi:hypothetical protein